MALHGGWPYLGWPYLLAGLTQCLVSYYGGRAYGNSSYWLSMLHIIMTNLRDMFVAQYQQESNFNKSFIVEREKLQPRYSACRKAKNQ